MGVIDKSKENEFPPIYLKCNLSLLYKPSSSCLLVLILRIGRDGVEYKAVGEDWYREKNQQTLQIGADKGKLGIDGTDINSTELKFFLGFSETFSPLGMIINASLEKLLANEVKVVEGIGELAIDTDKYKSYTNSKKVPVKGKLFL